MENIGTSGDTYIQWYHDIVLNRLEGIRNDNLRIATEIRIRELTHNNEIEYVCNQYIETLQKSIKEAKKEIEKTRKKIENRKRDIERERDIGK